MIAQHEHKRRPNGVLALEPCTHMCSEGCAMEVTLVREGAAISSLE